jgi:diguanylate cyclase (GGDEF)-like protein
MAQTPRPGLMTYLLFAVLYFATARFGGDFTTSPEGMAIIWAPNAILLAMLLRYDGAGYPLFALLTLLAEMAGDQPYYPWHQAIFFGMVDLFEATLAWRLMRAMRMSPGLETVEDMTKFVLAGPMLATLAGGLLGGGAILALGAAHEDYAALVRIWWFGDALGQMVFTPMILLLARRPDRFAVRINRTDALVALYTMLVTVLLAVSRNGMIDSVSITPTLLLPSILYVATRLLPAWSAASIALVAVVVCVLITRGHQPFGALPINQEVMRGQEFILVMAVLGMGFAALINELRDAKRGLEERVEQRTTQLLQVNLELARQVRTDSLTDLLNRRAFYEDAARECERCNRYGRPLALLMFDIDHFKAVNDQHGHLVGDRALAHFATVLRELARTSDTVARYGGEEFALLAPETDMESACRLAGRIRNALAGSPLEVDGAVIRMTSSIGIAEMQPDERLESLLARADGALYEAKASGRDRVRLAA